LDICKRGEGDLVVSCLLSVLGCWLSVFTFKLIYSNTCYKISAIAKRIYKPVNC
jgi:hypothetical protein